MIKEQIMAIKILAFLNSLYIILNTTNENQQ